MSALVPHGDAFQAALSFAGELAKADLLPKPYQRKPAMVLIAMEMAKDLGCSVVAVMNGTYEIGGRLAYYTDFMLAQARRMGAIRAVSYESKGVGEALGVTARATLGSGEVVEATVTMREAIADGWTRNPKYKSVPEQMLRKRAIKRLISNYIPEVMLGAALDEDEFTVVDSDVRASANIVEAPARKAVSRLTARLTPPSPAKVLPSFEAAVTESVKRDYQASKPVFDAEPAAEEAQVVESEEPPALDLTVKEHRALVTAALNALDINGPTRNKHNDALKRFLTERSDYIQATEEAVRDAVVAFFDTLAPPAQEGA